MPRRPEAQMPRSPDAQMPRRPDDQNPRCPDARMARIPDAQKPRSPDAQTYINPGPLCNLNGIFTIFFRMVKINRVFSLKSVILRLKIMSLSHLKEFH